jgi:Uma2 family endonuclease
MATAANVFLTPEEYLERERQAEFKSEYLRGSVYAMAGGTIRHARIVMSVARRLADKLAGRNCDVFSTDVRLSVPAAQLYTYPDVMVICDGSSAPDDRLDPVSSPIVIVEVLAESTRNYDRGEKFQCYRTLASLREYVTVAQDKIHVEQYTRQPTGQWLLTEYADPSSTIALSSLAVELQMADIYEKVTFS